MPGASPPLVNTAIRFIPPALPVPTLKSGPFEALPLRAVLYRAQASAWEQRVAAWSRRALPHEPSPREPRPAQPPHDVRIRLHDAPHQPGAVVLDHRDDRPLVYTQVIDVEPAVPALWAMRQTYGASLFSTYGWRRRSGAWPRAR